MDPLTTKGRSKAKGVLLVNRDQDAEPNESEHPEEARRANRLPGGLRFGASGLGVFRGLRVWAFGFEVLGFGGSRVCGLSRLRLRGFGVRWGLGLRVWASKGAFSSV